MNNYIKNLINEAFASKAQQRYFYAQAGKGGKKGKKWAKMAKEFSNDTDFKKIPDKISKDIDEVVDENGNLSRSRLPKDIHTKNTTSRKRTDKVVSSAAGSMGSHGVHGTQTSLRYWAESEEIKEIEMDDTLGYDETMGKDLPYKKALNYFMKELKFSKEEAIERLEMMGYIPDEKETIRLVENPQKYINDYVESVLVDKNHNSDIIKKQEDKNLNPLIIKQLNSLKKTLEKNNVSIDTILPYLK